MKSILLYIVIFTVINCKNRNQEKITSNESFGNFKESKYFNDDKILSDKFQVKFKGNSQSFNDLVLYYKYNESRKEELIPYCLIIVEKHKKYKFCSVAFLTFLEFYSEKPLEYNGTEESLIKYLKNLEMLNEEQKRFSLHFLNMGLENNDKSSIILLEKIYRNGIGVEKNIKKADSLHNVFIDLNKNDNFFKGD